MAKFEPCIVMDPPPQVGEFSGSNMDTVGALYVKLDPNVPKILATVTTACKRNASVDAWAGRHLRLVCETKPVVVHICPPSPAEAVDDALPKFVPAIVTVAPVLSELVGAFGWDRAVTTGASKLNTVIKQPNCPESVMYAALLYPTPDGITRTVVYDVQLVVPAKLTPIDVVGVKSMLPKFVPWNDTDMPRVVGAFAGETSVIIGPENVKRVAPDVPTSAEIVICTVTDPP
jgi:hypothetical protein